MSWVLALEFAPPISLVLLLTLYSPLLPSRASSLYTYFPRLHVPYALDLSKTTIRPSSSPFHNTQGFGVRTDYQRLLEVHSHTTFAILCPGCRHSIHTCCRLSAVYCLLSTVFCLLSTVCCLLQEHYLPQTHLAMHAHPPPPSDANF
jgi:hypothetical protein